MIVTNFTTTDDSIEQPKKKSKIQMETKTVEVTEINLEKNDTSTIYIRVGGELCGIVRVRDRSVTLYQDKKK